jgi:hypothetical protein
MTIRHITSPTRVEAAGTPPKLIDEYVGRVNSDTTALSVAHMRSPAGWEGALHVRHKEGVFEVSAGQAVITPAGEWVQYFTPNGAEYLAVCAPAFSPGTVNRDE